MEPSSLCRLRAPTQVRRAQTAGEGLGENLENVITLEPAGSQMVDIVLELEGGDAGGASFWAAEQWSVDDGMR